MKIDHIFGQRLFRFGCKVIPDGLRALTVGGKAVIKQLSVQHGEVRRHARRGRIAVFNPFFKVDKAHIARIKFGRAATAHNSAHGIPVEVLIDPQTEAEAACVPCHCGGALFVLQKALQLPGTGVQQEIGPLLVLQKV